MASGGRRVVRNISVDHDKRFSDYAASVERAGYAGELSYMVAHGCLAALRYHCWTQLSDVVGQASDVEVICRWHGPPRLLTSLLEKHDYLRDIQGVYCFTDAVRQCPEYVQKRWKRQDRASYALAMGRATIPSAIKRAELAVKPPPLMPTPQAAEDEQDDEAMGNDLFGQPIPVDGKRGNDRKTAGVEEQRNADPGYKGTCKYWNDAWARTEGRPYVWDSKTGNLLWTVFVRAGKDYHTATGWIKNYLDNRDAFYRGHDIGIFVSQLNRFTGGAAPTGIAGSNHGGHARPTRFDIDRIRGAAVPRPGGDASTA